jgi:hypothetical protein
MDIFRRGPQPHAGAGAKTGLALCFFDFMLLIKFLVCMEQLGMPTLLRANLVHHWSPQWFNQQ